MTWTVKSTAWTQWATSLQSSAEPTYRQPFKQSLQRGICLSRRHQTPALVRAEGGHGAVPNLARPLEVGPLLLRGDLLVLWEDDRGLDGKEVSLRLGRSPGVRCDKQ